MCECRASAKKNALEAVDDKSRVVLIVGDESVGKTSLFYCILTEEFLGSNSQAFPRSPHRDVIVNGKTYTAKLHEAPSECAYSSLHFRLYDDADVIILCFAADNQESLANVTNKWYPEIQKRKPLVPIVLVATKCDLKSVETVRNPTSYRNGQLTANLIGAVRYIECSAKTTEGCLEVLEVAIMSTLL